MAFVNYNNKEITVKIVYYGPALSGKTTCLRYIYETGDYRKKGKLITLDTDGDRTLFFDFLPIEVGKLGDYSIKMQLYTVPGQVAYNTTRKLVLQGSDGIVFVADSQMIMREQNIDSFNNLKENLKANNIVYEETPLILQYNKRDLREILPIEMLNKDLNPENKPSFATIGTSGENVLLALQTTMKMVIIHLKNKLSIFQKDKTVMFSREEMTDSIAKKNVMVQPPAPPKKPEPEPVSIMPPIEKPFVDAGADTEREDIFELSSSLMEEPLKTRDYDKNPDEEIFNLGDESRVEGEEQYPEIPEADLSQGWGDEVKETVLTETPPSERKAAQGRLKVKTQPFEAIEGIEGSGDDFDFKGEVSIMPESENVHEAVFDNELPFSEPNEPAGFDVRRGIDVPIHIEIPQDKDELTINLNLRIVINRRAKN